MNNETFEENFESQKVKAWNNYYIKYSDLTQEIKDLIIFLKEIVKQNKNGKKNNSDIENKENIGKDPTLISMLNKKQKSINNN